MFDALYLYLSHLLQLINDDSHKYNIGYFLDQITNTHHHRFPNVLRKSTHCQQGENTHSIKSICNKVSVLYHLLIIIVLSTDESDVTDRF